MKMLAKASIAIAALTIAGATPALAKDPKASAAKGATAAAEAPVKAKNPNQKVCVRSTPTGTRMPRMTCNTRAEWARAGVQLPADI